MWQPLTSILVVQCIYLLSVAQLELLRVRSEPAGLMFSIFEYLSNSGVEAAGLMPLVAAIADQVFIAALEV